MTLFWAAFRIVPTMKAEVSNMGGRGGSSGLSGGGDSPISKYGLTEESNIPEDLFDYVDSRYGRYASQIAEEIGISYDPEEDTLVSVTSGKNKAYALITDADPDEDTDVLDAIVSTGGRAGTQALAGIMERSRDRGKSIMWRTDNAASDDYYDSLGLGKYAKGQRGSRTYNIPNDQINTALTSVRKKS